MTVATIKSAPSRESEAGNSYSAPRRPQLSDRSQVRQEAVSHDVDLTTASATSLPIEPQSTLHLEPPGARSQFKALGICLRRPSATGPSVPVVSPQVRTIFETEFARIVGSVVDSDGELRKALAVDGNRGGDAGSSTTTVHGALIGDAAAKRALLGLNRVSVQIIIDEWLAKRFPGNTEEQRARVVDALVAKLEVDFPHLKHNGRWGFGQPYGTRMAAVAAKARLRRWFLPAAKAAFGEDVAALWKVYLDRKPGDTLEPIRFSGDSSVGRAFGDSRRVRQLVQSFKEQLVSYVQRNAKLTQLKEGETRRFGIGKKPWDANFSYPWTVPGNIAGGVGDSDGGRDGRWVTGHVDFTLEKRGQSRVVRVEPVLTITVKDCIDFMPGGGGAPIESVATTPLSRLEASGMAYDLPFEVQFDLQPAAFRVNLSF